jgi:hypothetical protein
MRLFCRMLSTLAVVIGCCCLASGRQDLRNPDAAWLTDYAKGLAMARETGKPLLIVFACLH